MSYGKTSELFVPLSSNVVLKRKKENIVCASVFESVVPLDALVDSIEQQVEN